MLGFRNFLSLGLWAWVVASLVIIFNLSNERDMFSGQVAMYREQCAALEEENVKLQKAEMTIIGQRHNDLKIDASCELISTSLPGEAVVLIEHRELDGKERAMCIVQSDAPIKVYASKKKVK